MLESDAFVVHRTVVRDDVEIAYVREGRGGVPLVLVHGWPETKRIWWRNIGPLAAAGFEVIVPDLRGFGDSPPPRDGFYDIAANARDIHALLVKLGHRRCVTAGGDYGGAITQDLAHRFPDLVARQVLFNTLNPLLPEEYEQAGVGGDQLEEVMQASEHIVRHGTDADGLAAELDTADKRRAYIRGFYVDRPWAARGSFDEPTAAFMAEPFTSAAAFRASLGIYAAFTDADKVSEPPQVAEPHTIPTLVLYGPEDTVSGRWFTRRMEIACAELLGPFIIERAGHFLQWERAEVFNQAVRYFCLDVLREPSRL